MLICRAYSCQFNDNAKESCKNADITITPLTMPSDIVEGENLVIGFVCVQGTEAMYEEKGYGEDIIEGEPF
jgi:hypothetical protein